MAIGSTVRRYLGGFLAPRATFGASGVRFKAFSGWDAASMGKRLSKWRTQSGGPNSLGVAELDKLRERSQAAIRNMPHARAARDSYVANLIGSGIKPQPLHKDEKVRDTIQREFRRWTDHCDFDNQTDYYGQQRNMAAAEFESGEVLIRFRTAPPRLRMRVPLQLEVIEAAHLASDFTEKALENGNVVRYGKEFDKDGRVVAYHLYKEHPGEPYYISNDGHKTIRVPADEIIHLYDQARPKQARGVPRLASVLVRLYLIDQYDDAELARKIITSSLTGFIYGAEQDNPVLPITDQAGAAPAAGQSAVTAVSEVEPGSFVELKGIEKVELVKTTEVSNMYDVFMRVQLQAVAIGCGQTYEKLTGDLSGVNFSSIRAGEREYQRKCEQIQHSVYIPQVCRRIFNKWLEYAAMNGVISASDYNANRTDYEDCKHIPPGWTWVDPLKDSSAAIQDIDAKLTSRSAVISARGDDPEEVDRQIAADQKRAKDLGLHESEDPQKLEQRKAVTKALLTEPDEPANNRKREVLQ